VLYRLRGSLCTVLVTHEPALAALADRTVALPRAFGTESPDVSRRNR
jgi:ATP-binding cassette subfamily C protein CydCD